MIETAESILRTLGVHGLRWLWVPFLLWTILAVPVHVFARGLARWDGRLPFWLHRAVWWALPAGLLLSATGLVGQFVYGAAPGAPAASGGPAVWIGVPVGVETAGAAVSEVSVLLLAAGLITVLALLVGAYHLARLVYGTVRLGFVRSRGSVRPKVSEAAWAIADRVGVRCPVEVIVSEEVRVPMTFGWWAPVVVVPAALVDRDEDLRLALTHELIHVRRGDYRESWMEELLHAVFAGYPLIGWFRRRLAFFREIACDAELLDRLEISRRAYARLLLRMADAGSRRGGHALAMSDSTSNLKDRIEAMSRGDRELPQSLDPRFFGAALGGVILLSGALVVACSEVTGPHLEEGASPAQDPPPPEPSVARGSPEAAGEPTPGERTPPPPPEDQSEPEVFVAVEQMPELIGGIRGLQEEIRYPDLARRAGIEGRVIVQFEVSRRGDVENATILRGIGAGCDAEALRVVRAAEFRPGLQRGEPVRVKLSLPITFRLGPDEGDAAPGPSDDSGTASDRSDAPALASSAVPVLVNADGEILLGREGPVQIQNLERRLRDLLDSGGNAPERAVDLTVQEDASLDRVRRIQQAIRGAGALRVNYRSVQ